MFKTGAHELGSGLHIPAPGKVQYYRAECLPFVPPEIKTQIRFPKAYPDSEQNLRYLDQVRMQTEKFMAENIQDNYFSTEKAVPLTATLGEVEVLYSAGDNVKTLASSGALNTLHERCNALTDGAQSSYITMKDKVENIIQTVQTKEDEIYSTIIEDHGLDLVKHDASDVSFRNYVKSMHFRRDIAVENLLVIESKLKEVPELESYKTQLVALVDVQVSAYDQLVQLQTSFVENVEDDAATREDLRIFTAQWEAFSGAKAKYGDASTDSAKLLGDQIGECTSNLGSA